MKQPIIKLVGTREHRAFLTINGQSVTVPREVARMIEAAPLLLEACEMALRAATEPVPLSEMRAEAERVRGMLRQAIAHARRVA